MFFELYSVQPALGRISMHLTTVCQRHTLTNFTDDLHVCPFKLGKVKETPNSLFKQ